MPQIQQMPPVQQYGQMPVQSKQVPKQEKKQEKKEEKKDKKPLPCTINTFGFGSDHDPKLLKDLADGAGGVYYFIQKTEEIPQMFATCLGGLISVAAQNITLKLEAPSEVKIKKVITRFATKEIEAKKTFEIQLGDIQSEEKRDILVVAEMPSLPHERSSFLLSTISLSYFNVITSKLDNAKVEVTVGRPDKVPPDQKVNFELDKQHNRLRCAEAMETATTEGTAGRLEKARGILDECIYQIKKSVSADAPFCKNLVLDLQKCRDGLQSTSTFQTFGHQQLATNAGAHYGQRVSNSRMQGQAEYGGMPQMLMEQNFQQQQQAPHK